MWPTSCPSCVNVVLFLDDNAINVEGAAAAGFRAHEARGVDAARSVLVGAGILTP